MNNLLNVIRYKEWYDSKWNCYYLVFIFFLLKNCRTFNLSLLIDMVMVLLFTFCILAFGYAYNDYCDKKEDLVVGKQNTISHYSIQRQIIILLLLLFVGIILPILYFKSIQSILIVTFSFFLAFLYSYRKTKIKEMYFIGLIVSSIAQRVSPLFLIFYIFKDLSISAIMISILSLLIGIRWILIHQYSDLYNDSKTGTKTFVLRQNNEIILLNIITLIFIFEILSLFTIFFVNLQLFCNWLILMLLVYFIFHAYLSTFWLKVGWKRMILSYDFAPMADFYYLWLPLFITCNLMIVDFKWICFALLCIYLGYRYLILDIKYYKLKICYK